jgi:hypothetical protein
MPLPDTLIVLPTIAERQAEAAALLATLTTDADVLVVLDGERLPDVLPESRHGRLVRYNHSLTRRGLVHAYRCGFEHLLRDTWQFLVMLEDGLTLTPGWDTAMRRTLTAHPQFGWVACGSIEHATAPFTPTCSMFTREAALATDGGPDLWFAPCQVDDGDMLLRLRSKGFAPHAVTHKVHHPVGRTSETEAERAWSLTGMQAHLWLLQQRWGVPDIDWSRELPMHDPYSCLACQGVGACP